MTSQAAIMHRPHAPLAAPDPAALSAGFPGMACAIFPNPAYAAEPIRVYLRLDAPLEEYEWRLATGEGQWGPWQPAGQPHTLTFLTTGLTIPLFYQARRGSSESPLGSARVELLPDCRGAAGPGAAFGLRFLEQGRLLALLFDDGVLYVDRQREERRFLRTTTGDREQILVASDGKAVTLQQTTEPDTHGYPATRRQITIHDHRTAGLVARFTPEANETLQGITPAGELILIHWQGNPTAPDATPKRTGYATRLVDPLSGQTLAVYDGKLVAVANGRGVLLYEAEPAFVFLPDYRDGSAAEHAVTYPAAGKDFRDLRICLAPSGNLAAVAGSRTYTVNGRTLVVPEYVIVRTVTGRRLATLWAKRVEQFANDELVWVSDHAERRLEDCLKLYDWKESRTIAAPPVYALAHGAGLKMNHEDERWHFGGDAGALDIIGGVCNRRVFYSLRAERHGRLHIVHERAHLNAVLATQTRVYYLFEDRPIEAFDQATGESRGELDREPRQPTRDGYPQNKAYAFGHLLFVNGTGIPIEWWGFDDRVNTYIHWRAPAEVIEATPIDSDEDTTALFNVTVGDPEHGLFQERFIDYQVNYAVNAIAGDWAANQKLPPVPENKWKENPPPPRFPGLALWNHHTDATHVVTLPWECGATIVTVWAPAQEGWLMMRSLPTEDEFNADRTQRTGRVLHRAFYLISRHGEVRELPQFAVPADFDAAITETYWPTGGPSCQSPRCFDPLIVLSRATPGQVVIGRRNQLAAFDVFRQEYVWQCANPLPPDVGPGSILPLPNNRVAASCRAGGWVTIDATGRIDPRDAWPNTALTLAGRCILMGSSGRWRPLQ